PELGHGEELYIRRGNARATPVRLRWAQTFGEVAAGECLLYEDSYGRLCIAQNQGNAAEALDLDEGAVLRISRDAPASGRKRSAPAEASGADE
ncbi:MAG TPA: SAM hydroxide adenosyltransferase, partial [Vicinamibacterales bacterium]|nr:SAM hydroxide adenosyltransferase [Vicinamibacterales bacterium]